MNKSTAILVVDNYVLVELFNADGGLVERHKGPSEYQLKAEHDTQKCGAFCGYCYDDAMKYLDGDYE